MHEEKKNKHKKEDAMPEGAVPPYLLDREGVSRAKVQLALCKSRVMRSCDRSSATQ